METSRALRVIFHAMSPRERVEWLRQMNQQSY